jgi:LPXTG-site transpeptidase (sortase) family protein
LPLLGWHIASLVPARPPPRFARRRKAPVKIVCPTSLFTLMIQTMNFKKANNILLAAIILLNSYVLVAPFAPQLYFWWHLNHAPTVQRLQAKIAAPLKPTGAPANRVIIPDMGLDVPIGEGSYGNRYAVLHAGVWRFNTGSTPDKGGNTTLVGHRFTYTNPRGIFYALDRVKIGSQIAVFWNNRKYFYQVSSVSVVDPSDTAIQNNTSDARLTIFTCTPLFHPTSRLVVVAEREEKS